MNVVMYRRIVKEHYAGSFKIDCIYGRIEFLHITPMLKHAWVNNLIIEPDEHTLALGVGFYVRVVATDSIGENYLFSEYRFLGRTIHDYIKVAFVLQDPFLSNTNRYYNAIIQQQQSLKGLFKAIDALNATQSLGLSVISKPSGLELIYRDRLIATHKELPYIVYALYIFLHTNYSTVDVIYFDRFIPYHIHEEVIKNTVISALIVPNFRELIVIHKSYNELRASMHAL